MRGQRGNLPVRITLEDHFSRAYRRLVQEAQKANRRSINQAGRAVGANTLRQLSRVTSQATRAANAVGAVGAATDNAMNAAAPNAARNVTRAAMATMTARSSIVGPIRRHRRTRLQTGSRGRIARQLDEFVKSQNPYAAMMLDRRRKQRRLGDLDRIMKRMGPEGFMQSRFIDDMMRYGKRDTASKLRQWRSGTYSPTGTGAFQIYKPTERLGKGVTRTALKRAGGFIDDPSRKGWDKLLGKTPGVPGLLFNQYDDKTINNLKKNIGKDKVALKALENVVNFQKGLASRDIYGLKTVQEQFQRLTKRSQAGLIKKYQSPIQRALGIDQSTVSFMQSAPARHQVIKDASKVAAQSKTIATQIAFGFPGHKSGSIRALQRQTAQVGAEIRQQRIQELASAMYMQPGYQASREGIYRARVVERYQRRYDRNYWGENPKFRNRYRIATEGLEGFNKVVGKLKANFIRFNDSIKSGTRSIGGRWRGFTSSVAGTAEAFDTIRNTGFTISAATMPAQEFVRQATHLQRDFVGNLNFIRGITGATDEEMRPVKEMALELGRQKPYTTSQVAGAMANLSLSGLRIPETLGVIGPVLDLASAGRVGVEFAGQTAAAAMRATRRGPSEMGRITDIYAKTQASTSATVRDLSIASRQILGTASAQGHEIEDLFAIIGLLRNQGQIPSTIGVYMRQILSFMARSRIQKDLQRMGVDVPASRKSFVKLIEELERVNAHGDKITEIFLGPSGSLINLLMNTGSAEIKRLSNELRNSAGFASRVAQLQESGIYGSYRRRDSAYEGMMHAAMEASIGFPPSMESIKTWVADAQFGAYSWIAGNKAAAQTIAVGAMGADLLGSSVTYAGQLGLAMIGVGQGFGHARTGVRNTKDFLKGRFSKEGRAQRQAYKDFNKAKKLDMKASKAEMKASKIGESDKGRRLLYTPGMRSKVLENAGILSKTDNKNTASFIKNTKLLALSTKNRVGALTGLSNLYKVYAASALAADLAAATSARSTAVVVVKFIWKQIVALGLLIKSYIITAAAAIGRAAASTFGAITAATGGLGLPLAVAGAAAVTAAGGYYLYRLHQQQSNLQSTQESFDNNFGGGGMPAFAAAPDATIENKVDIGINLSGDGADRAEVTSIQSTGDVSTNVTKNPSFDSGLR